jgi:phospholipid/cholesterol/gamma-HCH transport system substrate-binding protein
VGALVAVTGATFLVALTFFRKGGYADDESYVVHAYFGDATGLTWKSRVQIAGIQVGEVSRIGLEGNRARLELRIKNAIVLHADACVIKTYPSALLPDAILDANPGTTSAPLMKDLPPEQREITCVRESTSVQRLMDDMSKIAADISALTGDLAQTVGGEKGSVRDIVENLASITRKVEAAVDDNAGRLDKILANAESFSGDLRTIASRDRDRIGNIVKNLEQISEQVKQLLRSSQQLIDGASLDGSGAPGTPGVQGASVVVAGAVGEHPALAQAGAPPADPGVTPPGQAPAPGTQPGLRQAVERLNLSLEKVDGLLEKVGDGKSVAGKLLTDERMGRQLSTAVDGVSDYLDRLQKLQIQVNLRSEWLLNQSVEDGRPGAKVYFGGRILPRPDKYYLFEVVSDPRGIDTVTTETVTTGDETTVTTRVKHEDKLTFSLQMAKRYGPMTFRVGVIESSGGVGSDLHLLDDRLQVSISVYQFSRPYQDVFPRAKIWANYNFLQYFYVTTGVDDFFNRWRTATSAGGRQFSVGTDVFFGVGLQFTDDDVKTLLMSGAGSAVPSGN